MPEPERSLWVMSHIVPGVSCRWACPEERMNEGLESTGDGWTRANFTGAIHRGGVGLWAWSPTQRMAQLGSLCCEFWGVSESVIDIDALFARVNVDDRMALVEEWTASERDPHPYSFDFRIGAGSDARLI